MADILIQQARDNGAKAGAAFSNAYGTATQGGTASAISGSVDASGQGGSSGPGYDPMGPPGQSVEERMAAQAEAEKLAKDTLKWEKNLQDGKKKTHDMTLGFLQSQTKAGTAAAKVMAAVNSALAISQIMANTQAASTRALAELGPIAGAPVAAAIQAQGMVSVGIAAANGVLGQFHDGIDNVPNTGTYLLEQGERVVDKRLNADLTKALDGGGGFGGGNTVAITVNGVSDPETINRVISEQRPQFEQMLRDINQDRAGQGLL